MPLDSPAASQGHDANRRLSLMNDGDLGLFGLSSPSPPPTSLGVLTSSEPIPPRPNFVGTAATASPASSNQASPTSPSQRRLRMGQLDQSSKTSLTSNYYSAEEYGNAPTELSTSGDSSSLILQATSISPAPTVRDLQRSEPQTPTMTSRRQALSVEEESEINPPAAFSPRSRGGSKRSSRYRANLPPVEDRLPVGAGGPAAPPRTASVKPSGRRLSNGGGSNQGHGDLGSESMPGLSSQMALIGSPVLPSPSPSIGSRAELESSPKNSLKSLPIRSGSMTATPKTATSSHAGSPTKLQAGTTAGTDVDTSLPKAELGIGVAGRQSESKPATRAEPSLDREAMQRWVLSVGCVNFDLELGPDLEFLYPPLGISREERDNIAFSSFPDTSIFDVGFSVFSWRVREVPLDSSGSEPPTIRSGKAEQDEKAALEVDDKTPRPSFNKTFSQAQSSVKPASNKVITAPTSLTSPTLSRFRDNSSMSSSASSKSISRHASDANLNGSSSLSSGFHERLTSRLFSGNHSQSTSTTSSSTSSSVSRSEAHARKGSTASMESSTSADDDGELAAQASQVIISEKKANQVITAPKKPGSSTSSSYIYGYVFFRQKRDPTNRRGYFQKSVVILSHLPYVGLFSEVVSRLGPLYFEHGMTMFEAFANDIVSWPSPQPGSIITLPLLGSILTAAIPFGQQAQNSPNADVSTAVTSQAPTGLRATATMTLRHRSRLNQGNRELPEPLIGPEGPLLASIPSTSLFDTFKEGLTDMWLLWECVLLAEPILVIGSDPKAVSEAIWNMLDLIRPIPFAGDFRPYFHIHDYDFRTLVTKNKPQAGTLIGATNPFMATACSHWPHVLRVGRAAVKNGSGFRHSAGSGKKNGPIGGGVGGGHHAGGGGPDHIPGFTTKRKRRISKDRSLLKRLLELAAERKTAQQNCAQLDPQSDEAVTLSAASANSATAANVMMRRHFADLTERFLAPLNRYVASLVPADFDLSSPSEAPKIKPFNTTAFLASLKAHGTPLSIRSRSLPTGATVRQSLYLDFLKCPNFSLWLHSRVAAAEEEQRRRYIAALVQGDVTAFGHMRGEIETIDLYSRLVEEIRLVDVQLTAPTEPGAGSRWRTDKPLLVKTKAAASSGRSTPVNGATSWPTTEKRLTDQKAKLMEQLDKLCLTLPDDLRSSLRRPS